MARLGETDPRWIVAERADGVNVNQWHWDQRDLTNTCETRLREIFSCRKLVETDEFVIEALNFSEFKGDVTVANRKGKRRCFFEFSFVLNFEVRPRNESGVVPFTGKYSIPDCDTQNYIESFDISVTSEENLSIQELAAQACRGEGREAIRHILRNFIEAELMASNGCASNPMQIKSESTYTSSKLSSQHAVAKEANPADSGVTSSDTIRFNKRWRASVDDVWDCFVISEKVAAYTRSPCNIKPRVGGDFSMLSDAVKGTFIEFVEKKRLVMKWRLSSWSPNEGQESIVAIDLSPTDGGVEMEFEHSGIPVGDLQRVRSGWETNFWESIEKILGYKTF